MRQAFGNRDEELVTHCMSKTVIDKLEAVEVEKEHRETVIDARVIPFDRLVETVGKECPVWQAGQRIVKCVVKQPSVQSCQLPIGLLKRSSTFCNAFF